MMTPVGLFYADLPTHKHSTPQKKPLKTALNASPKTHLAWVLIQRVFLAGNSYVVQNCDSERFQSGRGQYGRPRTSRKTIKCRSGFACGVH